MNKNRFVALIPAREGSKGIKNKNLLKIGKFSLVELAIKNACVSKKIDEIYLSSDSKRILKITQKYPKVKSYLRNKKYASDSSSSKDVIGDFIKKFSFDKIENISIVYIQPSSPFKNSYHLDKAIKIFEKQKKNTLVSCYKASENFKEKLLKSFILLKKKKIKPSFKQKNLHSNRQKLSDIYIPNGSIFIFRITKNFLKTYINFESSIGYIMRENEAIDINDKKDYKKAKKIIK